ncbi:secondary thiamine-phosphate synthase enzyme YjbQ [Streptomyces sp. bgisy091]|uniref:secondary thiamine-phosphate synthase enzyme YjbQ n=1 Tax=Streptomyces sp. bgisy091 TaxID=3413778 RepID=UPI003D70E03E
MADTFSTHVLSLTTGRTETVMDLTDECADFLARTARGRNGLLNIFVPHATAGIAILETGAGSDDDLLAALQTLLPADDRWRHRHGSPGHGRDHVLPALVPPHATLPVVGGALELGTWQSVCLVESRVTNVDNWGACAERFRGRFDPLFRPVPRT